VRTSTVCSPRHTGTESITPAPEWTRYVRPRERACYLVRVACGLVERVQVTGEPALVVMDALLAYLLGLALIAWVLRADTEKADP